MRIEVEVRGQRQEIKNAVYSAQQSENCLECAFDFITPEWQGLVKTAHFRAEPDGEVFCAVLQEDQCLVPSKVLEKDGYFSFSVIVCPIQNYPDAVFLYYSVISLIRIFRSSQLLI